MLRVNNWLFSANSDSSVSVENQSVETAFSFPSLLLMLLMHRCTSHLSFFHVEVLLAAQVVRTNEHDVDVWSLSHALIIVDPANPSRHFGGFNPTYRWSKIQAHTIINVTIENWTQPSNDNRYFSVEVAWTTILDWRRLVLVVRKALSFRSHIRNFHFQAPEVNMKVPFQASELNECGVGVYTREWYQHVCYSKAVFNFIW